MCYVLPFIKWIFAYQNVHTLNCSTGLFSKVTLGRVPKDPELMKQHFLWQMLQSDYLTVCPMRAATN